MKKTTGCSTEEVLAVLGHELGEFWVTNSNSGVPCIGYLMSRITPLESVVYNIPDICLIFSKSCW